MVYHPTEIKRKIPGFAHGINGTLSLPRDKKPVGNNSIFEDTYFLEKLNFHTNGLCEETRYRV